MRRLQRWIRSNELFTRLMVIVIISIILISILTTVIAFNRSKDAYLDSYQNSNQLLMTKIQDDYETLNENIQRIFETVDNSQVVEQYLKSDQSDLGQLIIDLKKQMADTRSIFEDIPSNLILLGRNGKTFFQNDGVRSQSIEDFLSGELITTFDQSSAVSHYFYRDAGITTSTQNEPGLMFIRKLSDQKTTFGYALIFIPEQKFASIYTTLMNDQFHKIQIVNKQRQIISSNQKQLLGKSLKLKNSPKEILSKLPLYSYNFTLYNSLNETKLIQNMNWLRPTLLVATLGILIVSFLAFWIVRQTTQPIYHLIGKLTATKSGDFSNKVHLEGTREIKELGKAYNSMLTELQTYFDHLLETEKEKRLAEIRSLQMQIQPHFIYNTLTSIKFLIWQQQTEDAVLAIENFIVLLRQTLGNPSEVVSLEEELAGVKAYTHILKLRYGDNIQVNFLASDDTLACLVPKMIIQPIIENAYLYAFPNQTEGFIQVFTQKKEDKLYIEIMDNGIGFDTTQLQQPANFQLKSTYSGIGLRNINERIHLLYGSSFGLDIHSEQHNGTLVTLILPWKI